GTKEGYVEIDFQCKGKKYRARRTMDKRSTSFKLLQYIDGGYKPIVESDTNSQHEQKFKQIFPVPKEVFLQIVTKVQTDDTRYHLGSFCKATPKGMYDIIKEFVEVVKIEKYEKKNKEIIQELNNNVIEYESTINTSKDAIENLDLRPVKDREIEGLKKRIKNINKKINKERKASMRSEKWYKQKEKYDKAKKTIKKFNGIKDWYERWQPLKAIKKPEEIYDPETLKELKDKLENEKELVKGIPDEIKEYKENIKSEKNKLKDIKQKYNKLKEENEKIYAKIDKIEKKLSLLKAGKCSECARRFNKTEERIKKKKAEKEEVKKELHPEKKLKNLKEKKNEIEESIKAFENKIDSLQELRIKTTNKVSELSNTITKMESSKEATEKWRKKQKFLKEYENTPFKKIGPDEGYRKLKNAEDVDPPEGEKPRPMTEIEDEIEDMENIRDMIKDKLNKLQNKKEQYEYHINKIKEAKAELKKFETDLEKHKKLAKVYSRTGAPHFMVKEYLQNLQHYANIYLDRFTKGRIAIEFKTNHSNKNKPIELIFYDAERNNKPRKYNTFSRGEKTRVALSIEFLAMSKTFSQLTDIDLQTGLIDEVYGLDEEGQKEFAEILTEMSGARPVMGGVVCFESMAHNFENVIKVEDGRLIQNG
ncbi:MAG: hypothetical protein ACOCT9_02155, partial [archaeon]